MWGLLNKCAKWEQQGWVWSRGALVHVDLWTGLWSQWQLSGDSVTVSSHALPCRVGIQGNA